MMPATENRPGAARHDRHGVSPTTRQHGSPTRRQHNSPSARQYGSPTRRQHNSPSTRQYGSRSRRQHGFSLVAVIFLIVVLAGLAAFAVQVAMSQYQGASLVLLEARAQAAADTGIEYGANRTLRGVGGCAAIRPATLTLSQAGLTGYLVNVSCKSTGSHVIKGRSYPVYVLTSTATYGTYGQSGYVSRTVTRNVTNAPP